jgi:molybdopterin molybdotransferase
MRSVEEHQAIVASLITGPAPVTVPLAQALGRALAQDVYAVIDLPGFDNSAMDGYAGRAAELASPPVTLPVADDIPAGRVDVAPLEPGTVHRIMTGAPIPPGADAVVPVEGTDGGTAQVTIVQSPRLGLHIRRAGEDVRAGDLVLPTGTVLGASQLGLLAALGTTSVPVVPPLRVLVLSTGSELVEPGQPLRPGQIYESNAVMITAAVSAAGGSPQRLKFVPDDVDQFLAALTPHLGDVDVIITSGGVSAGAFEVVKDALTGTGVEFAKVAMQPGMPQGAGRFQGVPVITLPGNPVSALVSFEVFIRPALRMAMGLSPNRRAVRARIDEAITSPAGRRQFRRGRLIGDDVLGYRVHPVGPPGSHFMRWLAAADCLIDLGTDISEVAAESVVDVWVLD